MFFNFDIVYFLFHISIAELAKGSHWAASFVFFGSLMTLGQKFRNKTSFKLFTNYYYRPCINHNFQYVELRRKIGIFELLSIDLFCVPQNTKYQLFKKLFLECLKINRIVETTWLVSPLLYWCVSLVLKPKKQLFLKNEICKNKLSLGIWKVRTVHPND